MTLAAATLPPGQPDPIWLRRMLVFQGVSLAVVGILSIESIAAWLIPQFSAELPAWAPLLSGPIAISALLCVVSLAFAAIHDSPLPLFLSRLLALVPALGNLTILLANIGHLPTLSIGFPAASPENLVVGSGTLQAVVAFCVLSVGMLLMLFRGPWLRITGDIIVGTLCFLAIVLVSQSLFGTAGLFGLTSENLVQPLTLFCIVMLTTVVMLRQAEFGVFSIFLGTGIGSRIARGFAPVLLIWPFFREVVEGQSGFRHLLPEHFAASILTALAVCISLVFLILIVWRINEMEKEIHDLTLRDELTGLYNMRGFYLLAEQTLRLAQRSKQPFSVLFLDLDGLKQINDQQGHQVGSAYLAETGEIVQACFRDADVKGRFGGDEFVVAGQFTMVGIEIAAQRLQTAAEERNAKGNRRYPLSFSIGHVTSDYYSTETLKELVTRADEEMYKDKRSRKAHRN